MGYFLSTSQFFNIICYVTQYNVFQNKVVYVGIRRRIDNIFIKLWMCPVVVLCVNGWAGWGCGMQLEGCWWVFEVN